MRYSKQNIFNLPQSELFGCQVFFYHKQHSYLLIGAYNSSTQDRRYFYFSGVEYFEGPMVWTGSNICVATNSEQKKLLSDLNLDIDLYSNTCNLYLIEGRNVRVRILSSSVNETEDISESFPYVYKNDRDQLSLGSN